MVHDSGSTTVLLWFYCGSATLIATIHMFLTLLLSQAQLLKKALLVVPKQNVSCKMHRATLTVYQMHIRDKKPQNPPKNQSLQILSTEWIKS